MAVLFVSMFMTREGGSATEHRPAPSPTPAMAERFHTESPMLRSDPSRPAAPPPPQPRPASAAPVTIELPPGLQPRLVEPSAAGAPEPGPPAAKSNFDLLAAELETAIKSTDWDGGTLGAYAQDGRHPLTLINHNGDRMMTPAAAQRLITAGAALSTLGPEYQFPTAIQTAGRVENGALKGNLIIRGSGDPSISSRFEGSRPGDPLAPFRAWARRLYSEGIGAIHGNIIGDAGLLDAERHGPGWPDVPDGEWSRAEVSALSFNENLIEFHWLPERRKAKRGRYDLSPRLDYIQVHNQVRVDEQGRQNWRAYSRRPDSNLFDVLGWLPPSVRAADAASIHNPPSYFLTALKEALGQEGIAVSGAALPLGDSAMPDLATSGALTLYVHFSPPLPDLLRTMIQFDQPLHAELLFKTIGRHAGFGGSFAGGRQAVGAWMESRRLNAPGAVAMDGSGLSRLNRISARQIVEAMKEMEKTPAGRDVLEHLPRAGRPGALADGFLWSEAARNLADNIHAVPGYRPGAYSLAGWALTSRGRRIYFTFLLNGSRLGRAEAAERLERLAAVIAQSPLGAGI